MANTTSNPDQTEQNFELIRTQLLAGVNVCGATNEGKRYIAACHLIGISAYIRALAEEIKMSYEIDKSS